MGGHRQRRRQDGRDAERQAGEDREDVDPEGTQAGSPGQPVAARQHHHGVMAAVGDDGDHRDLAAQGESHETFPAGEIDLVPLGPRAAGLTVAPRVHQDARPSGQQGLGFAGAGRDDAELTKEGRDAGHGEQEIVGEHVGRCADAAA